MTFDKRPRKIILANAAREYEITISDEYIVPIVKFVLDDGLTIYNAIEKVMWDSGQETTPKGYVETDIPLFPEDQLWQDGRIESDEKSSALDAIEKRLAAEEAKQKGTAENETVTEGATTIPPESGKVSGPVVQEDNGSEAEGTDTQAFKKPQDGGQDVGPDNENGKNIANSLTPAPEHGRAVQRPEQNRVRTIF